MTGLPVIYGGSSGLAPTYDWVDLIGGLGYKRFYGLGSVASAGNAGTYFLSTKAMDGSTYVVSGNDAFGWATKKSQTTGTMLDVDFDITFNVPNIVAVGDAFVNVSHTCLTDGATYVLTATLYHVRGVTETALGSSASSPARAGETTSPYNSFRECLKISVTASKKFAIGDKLRLSIQIVKQEGGNGGVWLFHDPTSAVSVTDAGPTWPRAIGTDLTVDIPFRIDL